MNNEYSKLNPVKLSLAAGIITAICVALTTIAGILGWFPEYTALSFDWLTSIYGFAGYKGATWLSVFLGAIYSFIDVFIITAIFAWIYNKLL